MVQHVDILPTLLSTAGVRGDSVVRPGRNVVPTDSGSVSRTTVHVYSHLNLDVNHFDSFIADSYHIIRHDPNIDRGGLQLYRLDSDPFETHDLTPQQPILTGYYVAQLRAMRRSQRTGTLSAKAEISEELDEQLRQLCPASTTFVQ
jgi:arylsulfatase A-like enzyme